MDIKSVNNNLSKLEGVLEGSLFYDDIHRILYSTDASVYKEKPLAVAYPVSDRDIKNLIKFARNNNTSLIPRTAGTSLAGQVVGNGIIVDLSKHFTKIIELNTDEEWVRVQPGVVLDELNIFLKNHDLFFAPETSTANRCMIGGMLGNNACGLHSLIYGSTRDHVLSVKGFLSNGDYVNFEEISTEKFFAKCKEKTSEGKIYNTLNEILNNKETRENIIKEFPDPDLPRRNNGYAIDILANTDPFVSNGIKINLSKLIAGSEGTLIFATEIKLNLIPAPPEDKMLICVHFKDVHEALKANLIALKFKPGAVELMDKVILDCTKSNKEQTQNRFFLKGDPGAILMIEFARDSRNDLEIISEGLINELKDSVLGYHYPIIRGKDINRVWNLRKAGLGVLANIPGDKKSVPVIEDTAVKPELLPDYISEIDKIFSKYGFQGVYYAHVGSGELHLRPILNLKDPEDVIKFKELAYETARLVKSYRGSMSGEHGDGRVRTELIPLLIGASNYELVKRIKKSWDPLEVFNPGKITNPLPMNSHLRYLPGQKTKDIKTIFDFSSSMGFMRAVEKCNGSGDCRKTEVIGGTMCPSYMASRDENKTTRARANLLREIIGNSSKRNPFDHKEIYEIMDLCLSCKACKTECPSNIDMAKLKAEFLQHYYDARGIPLRVRLIAHISRIYSLASFIPQFANIILGNKLIMSPILKVLGFSDKRSLPKLNIISLQKWAGENIKSVKGTHRPGRKVVLFNDEFTNLNDTSLGIKVLKLLSSLGYEIIIPSGLESGRAYLSKGLIRKAKKIAEKNIRILSQIVNAETLMIGIEPSAILSFRDEYLELVDKKYYQDAESVSNYTYMIDEFLMNEMKENKIDKILFTKNKKTIKLHGHCQQKAIASTDSSKYILSFPENYDVTEIKSGCCGMAGSFGYEKEHYDFSMKVGELVLFPEIRDTSGNTIISAPGTSCRQHIKDGTGRDSFHPVEILYNALINNH